MNTYGCWGAGMVGVYGVVGIQGVGRWVAVVGYRLGVSGCFFLNI